MQDLRKKILEEVIEKQSRTDVITLVLITVTLALHFAVGALQFYGKIPFIVSAALSCFFMNMSFTFWHECSHENLSRNRKFNMMIGILTSFFSFFPGYFARRREHLIHHKFEGIPGKDPVYYRIQKTNFFKFLWTAVSINYLEKVPNEVPDSFLALSTKEKIIDRLTVLSVWFISVLLVWAGQWQTALAVIFIPRVFIFVFHGYVICFYPHFLPEGGFRKYRVFKKGFLLQALSMNQIYHGVHHFSPRVRWYNYAKVTENYHELLKHNEIEQR